MSQLNLDITVLTLRYNNEKPEHGDNVMFVRARSDSNNQFRSRKRYKPDNKTYPEVYWYNVPLRL